MKRPVTTETIATDVPSFVQGASRQASFTRPGTRSACCCYLPTSQWQSPLTTANSPHQPAEAGAQGRGVRRPENPIKAGLQKLGLSLGEARELRQNDIRKQGLMWLVKSQTVVTDAWVQQALEVGDRSNISRAVGVYRQEGSREIKKMKKVLHLCTDCPLHA